jgi:uroporphyrinogen-III synthase
MVQKTPSLNGKTIAITRPAGQAEEAGNLIKEKGGSPYYIPAIEIKGLSNFEPIKKFLAEMLDLEVDYVIFMSTNGVKHLFNSAQEIGQTSQLKEGLAATFVIAVGPKTAEVLEKEYSVHVSLIPTKYSSEGLIECFEEGEVFGKKIRIPRTSNATPTLTDKLKEMGADVQEIYVYESGLPNDEETKTKFFNDLTVGKIDAMVFGSGLSAKNIFKMLSGKTSMEKLREIVNSKVTIVAIGPTTAEALKELGVNVDVMPEDYLFEKALAALADYWNTH